MLKLENSVLTDMEERIFKLAEPYLGVRGNDVHTRMAVNFASRLLDLRPGDRAVVIPAMILHDVGWSEVPEEIMSKAYGPKADRRLTRMHEQAGKRIATAILEKIGYDPMKTMEIVQIVEIHDTGGEPLSLNDEIVRDADKLSRFSREEFMARAVEFGLTPQENYDRLERAVESWFFLPESIRMAREELVRRESEIDSLPSSTAP